MKVKIGPYVNWIGPYQISSFLFSWYPKEKDEFGFEKEADFIHDFGTWLSGGEEHESLLMKFCSWVHSKKQRKIKIKIDRWDSWNAHNTASLILHPLFKQLKETKHGSGFVDDEDVPEELRSTAAEPLTQEEQDQGYTDNNFHKRYEWMLSEVIWALEQDNSDWEDQFHTGEHDLKSVACEWDSNGKPTMYTMQEGPNHTAKFDKDGYTEYSKRIDNGFRLMGKYWRTFWD